MGRIKTQLVKRASHELLDGNEEKFSKEFNENKKIVDSMADVPSKKIRNIIAGYVTRLVRKGDF